jgi:hypothetical protein
LPESIDALVILHSWYTVLHKEKFRGISEKFLFVLVA